MQSRGRITVAERHVNRYQIVPLPVDRMVRACLFLTLSFDHAMVDGAPAARFAATLRQLLGSAAVFDQPQSQGGDHATGTPSVQLSR